MDGDNIVAAEKQSSSIILRRFIGLIYNFLFVTLFMIAFTLLGFIFTAILAFFTRNLIGPIVAAFFFLSPVAVFLYMSHQTSRGRQTYGYKSMGLKVVDQNGNDISFSKSMVRNLLWIICALPLGLGIAWAVFNRSGRGLHDLILGTKVVSKEDLKIPALAYIPFLLGLFIFLNLFIIFAVTIGIISFSNFIGTLLIILLYLIPSTFIFGLISRIVIRRKGQDKPALNLLSQSMTISVIAGIIYIMTAVAIPSSPLILPQIQELRCEGEIKKIAVLLDVFIQRNKRCPQDLSELVKELNNTDIPKFRYNMDYIYRVEKINDKETYVIGCPKPDELLKGRGLLSPRKCQSIKYVQGEGLVVITD